MLEGDIILKKIAEAQSGCNKAKEEIITANLPLIKSIVRRYRNKQIEYDDLMQLGTLGLIKAVNNFNLNFGVKFSTYAVPMIAGEIKRFLRDDGAIKVSRSIKAEAQEMNRFIEEYRHNFQKEPAVNEIADKFNTDVAEVIFVLESVRYPISIYQENDEDGLTLAEKIASKGTPEDMMDKLLLKEMIENLPPREKQIIILRYFRDKTQSEIAEEMNVSQVQISRLEAKILAKMREELEAN
ncbi:MAG: SigB/SigF/SigG family RNA polymerase sigma factor [Firmicutes bacterium]|nr:SigB/SigF/SigG family RNA polymerase sigma factor [Bacillota bacterium]